MSNNSKGAYKLATVLQKRMKQVSGRSNDVSSELGSIAPGNKLKVDSLPEFLIDDDDYSVCQSVIKSSPLKSGDRVLVVWTNDGEPVVIDKIAAGNET